MCYLYRDVTIYYSPLIGQTLDTLGYHVSKTNPGNRNCPRDLPIPTDVPMGGVGPIVSNLQESQPCCKRAGHSICRDFSF